MNQFVDLLKMIEKHIQIIVKHVPYSPEKFWGM